MGEKIKRKMIIKNIGIGIVFCIFCSVFWMLVLDLNYIMDNDLLIGRIIGIMILMMLAYVPYFFLHKYIDKIKLLEVTLIISIIFSALNIYFLLNLVLNNLNGFGVWGIFMYEVLFLLVVGLILIVDKVVRICLKSDSAFM